VRYRTSPLVALAGLLLIVFGIGLIALGAFTFTQGTELGRFIRDNTIAVFGSTISRETLRSVLSPAPGVLIVLGALQLISGIGVLAHKGSGRWLGVLLALLGLLAAVFSLSIALALSTAVTVPVLVAVVLLIGYAIVLLALIAGGSHFRRRPASP
jgi:hypothetical protein